MIVYIEYVLIDNFVIDFLLLKATYSITGCGKGGLRIVLAAMFGAVVALIFPLIEKIPVISVLVKILSGLTLVLLSVKAKTFRDYYINALLFFAFTFLLGGAITGTFGIFNIPYSSEISVALMFIPAYILIRVITAVVKYLYRQKDIAGLVYKTEITFNGKTVILKGFMDTGNGLYNGDSPVVVVDKRTAKELLGDFHGVRLRRIKVRTASGDSENLAFDIDKIKIYIGDKVNIYSKVTACVSSSGIGDGYQVILHPALMENSYDSFRETEKVC